MFIGFVFPSSHIFPDSYYAIKNPKVLKFTGKVLGVKYFRILLLFAFWRREQNRKTYFNGTKKCLKSFIFRTKQSEFGHFVAFIFILISSMLLLVYGYIFLVFILTRINIIGNVYPVILQRLHRLRIEKIIK